MSTTPDQIPRLNVKLQLGIPEWETSGRPTNLIDRDEVSFGWNKTDSDFDIFINGEWHNYIDLINLYGIFVTKEEFYSHDTMAYMLSLHQSVNNLFLEMQELRKSLGVDLMMGRD